VSSTYLSNDLYPTCFTLLPNSQLTMNIPSSCYCTVDVFAVIHFVTVSSMWSLLMAANLCMLFLYCLLIQLCPLVIQLSREKGWDSLNRLIPPNLELIPGFSTSYVVILFCVVSEWRWEVNVLLILVELLAITVETFFSWYMPGYKKVT
jgi:hypothetical protein